MVFVTAVVGLLTAILPRPWKCVPWVFVAPNSIARICAGAHHPLDIVGGSNARRHWSSSECGRRRVTTGRSVSSRAAARRRLALGIGVLVAATAPTRRDRPPRLELECFDAVNSLPDALYRPVWPVMRFGGLPAVPATAGVIWLTGDRGRATRILAGGAATWALAKVVKRVVRRGRPAMVDPNVRVRGPAPSGDGFVSGHAAVAVVLAAGSIRSVPALDPMLAVLAAAVGLSRMYVGAHLPLDVLGGAALGLIVDSSIELAFPL